MKKRIINLLQKYREVLDTTPYNANELTYASGYNNGRNVILNGIVCDLTKLQEEWNSHREIILEENGLVLVKWKNEFVVWNRDLVGDGFNTGCYCTNFESAKANFDKRLAKSKGEIVTEVPVLSYYRYTCTQCGDTFKVSSETGDSSIDYCPYCGVKRNDEEDVNIELIEFDTDYCYELGKRHEELEKY